MFRARSVQEAWGILSKILTPGRLPEWGLTGWVCGALIIGLVICDWTQRKHHHALENLALPTGLRWTVYGLLVFMMLILAPTEQTPFIYFQF